MRKLLAALVKPAGERLDLLVNDSVRANVASLRKCLAADLALVRALAGVPALVCLGEESVLNSANNVQLVGG